MTAFETVRPAVTFYSLPAICARFMTLRDKLIFIDRLGRTCSKVSQLYRAHNEGTFPITGYPRITP